MLPLDLLELHWITLICIPSHPSVFNGSHSWRQTLATFTLALPARLRSKAREVMQCNAMQCLWPLSKPRRPKSTKTLRSTCSWDGELERPWTSINHRSKINPLLDEATRASEPASRKSIAASFVFAVASVRFGACLRRGVGQRERSRSLDGCLIRRRGFWRESDLWTWRDL